MNIAFRKTMKNVRRLRGIKLVKINRRRSYLVSEPNYHTTKWFPNNSLAIEINKINLIIKDPVYLRLSFRYISQRIQNQDRGPGYGGNARLCYMNTNSFILHAKPKDVPADLAEGVQTRFHTSNYEAAKHSALVQCMFG